MPKGVKGQRLMTIDIYKAKEPEITRFTNVKRVKKYSNGNLKIELEYNEQIQEYHIEFENYDWFEIGDK